MRAFIARAIAWLRLTPNGIRDDDVRQWRSFNPGRCMYCAYTRWANGEQGQSLKIEAHPCPEGNGPPAPLPIARVL